MPLSNSYYKNDQAFLAVTDIDRLTLSVYCPLGKGCRLSCFSCAVEGLQGIDRLGGNLADREIPVFL